VVTFTIAGCVGSTAQQPPPRQSNASKQPKVVYLAVLFARPGAGASATLASDRAEAKRVLEQASAYLKINPCPAVLPNCEIELRPRDQLLRADHPTGVFVGEGVKNIRKEFPAAEILIVKRLEGTICSAAKGFPAGCYQKKDENDKGLIILTRDKNPGWILAHEWGHRQTLLHRDDPRALMHCDYGPQRTHLSEPEWKTLLDPLVNPPPAGVERCTTR
jgi:hypothetical protein